MEFSELVRSEREKRFKSAKEFHREAGLDFTYGRYADIEAGKGPLPSSETALQIARALGLPLKKALSAWTRDQMPDAEAKSLFADETDGEAALVDDTHQPAGQPLSKVQAKLLDKEPLYFEILLFLATRDGMTAHVTDIARDLHVDPKRTHNLLTFLVDYGVIEGPNDGTYRLRARPSLALDAEYAPLRLELARSAFEKFTAAADDESKFASTLTRPLTKAQILELRRKLAALCSWLNALPVARNPEEARPYTLGLFGSPRSFGLVEKSGSRGRAKEKS
jgi:transcriptional regulator with XRE-family HTH domain